MIGALKINGKDAYTTWGLTLTSSALSALMTPAPLKEFVSNKSLVEDGRQVLGISSDSRDKYRPRIDERSLTLELNISASSEEEFMRRYAGFCTELEGGVLDIETKYQEGVVYHTIYESCQQFSQFRRGVGCFALRLTEYNPKDRSRW